jgi:hypothetical protein
MSEDNEQNKDLLDKQEFKFSDLFTGLLNISALLIIIAIIAIFLSFLINDDNKKDDEKISEIKEEFKFTGNEKIDVENFNKLIDKRFLDYKKQIKISEKERNEDFRYYSALIGFIFSIVGFFGFKSIHDTRQAAIEKAVFDAKKEATDVAKKEATVVAKSIAVETVEAEIEGLTKKETINYLDNNLKKHLDYIQETVIQDFQSRLDEIQNNVDILKNPGNFDENVRPTFYKNTEIAILDLKNSIENFQKDLYDFKNDELKKSIILELSKK